jgi:hypothetical protein
MTTLGASPNQPTLREVIVAGDRDAAAGFFDGRGAMIREYCDELCSPPLVDDAVIAAFSDFRGRLIMAPADADLDDLLRKATRSIAATRMDVHAATDRERDRRAISGTCLALPELLAAHRNGELRHGDEPIRQHLRDCRVCQYTEERLANAEEAFTRTPSGQPPQRVRDAWLGLAPC